MLRFGIAVLTATIALTIASSSCPAATLIDEQFDYSPQALTAANGLWKVHAGTQSPIQVMSGGSLSTAEMKGVVGNRIAFGGSTTQDREDINRESGASLANGQSLYASFVIKVNSIGTSSGDQFVHFMADASNWRALFSIKSAGTGACNFGIRYSTGAAIWAPATLSIGTPYLVVISYDKIAGAADTSRLWISPQISQTEPVADVTAPQAATTDETLQFSKIALRQGSAASSIELDSLTVAISWADAVYRWVPVTVSGYSVE